MIDCPVVCDDLIGPLLIGYGRDLVVCCDCCVGCRAGTIYCDLF